MSREAYYLDRISRQTQAELMVVKAAAEEIERLRRENEILKQGLRQKERELYESNRER